MLVLFAAGTASAQEASELRLRGAISGGFVVSGDQHSVFGLDLPVLQGEVQAGWVAHEVVVLEARLGGGAFLSSSRDPGGLIDLSVGVEVGGDLDVGRAWGSVHAGAGLTGDLVRPVLRLALGLDIDASEEFAVGPVIAYGHVFQDDGEPFSDDASFVTIGISLTHQGRLGPRGEDTTPPPRRPRPPLPAARPPRLPTPPPPPSPPEELMDMLDEAAGLAPRELIVNVLFTFDSTDLVQCSVASLHSLRDHLARHPEVELLEIEGHADGSGGDEYNLDLSLRRARVIRQWLVEHGVEAERLRVAARGEAAPLESNEAEDGRSQNRRARFRVVLER